MSKQHAASSSSGGSSPSVIRLHPLQYAHVTNRNTNITEVVLGPQNRQISSNEVIVKPPTSYFVVPRGHYCRIRNPHERAVNPGTGLEEPVVDRFGQVKVRIGAEEIRYEVPPFPLYPEEEVVQVKPLEVLKTNEALVIAITEDYMGEVALDEKGGKMKKTKQSRQGDMYLLRGPATYYPRTEERISERRTATVVPETSALHCKALDNFEEDDEEDASSGSGKKVLRHAGEAYLRLKPGAYIAKPLEEIMCVVQPIYLERNMGLHVEVAADYVDPRDFALGKTRKAGDVFLVTGASDGDGCHCFIPHPYDLILKHVERIDVSLQEYCVVCDPVEADGTQSFGDRRIINNASFFLKPGESLEDNTRPRPVYLLSSDQAVLVVAVADFTDADTAPATSSGAASTVVKRVRGDRWLVRGPRRLVPNRYIKIVPDPRTGREIRARIILTEGQGLYIRDTTTGVIRAVFGPTSYMLEVTEEAWEKPLAPHVERRLGNQFVSHAAYMDKQPHVEGGLLGKTDRAIAYHIPYRSVTQLYNYKTQRTRTVFGPGRILLEPDEGFTVVSLSGSPWDPANPTKCLPKQPNHITSLYLFLGPSNMSDVVHIETRDHAQLALQLCYDWYFDIERGSAEKAFSVNDFVGDCCSFIASRVRAAVASLPFEVFHKNSARCLKEAVFGVDETTGLPLKELRFSANNLVITSVDTQEMEVLDARTRQGLQKSANMAIEITTHAQEASAQQIATAREQAARGQLERQRVSDQVANEEKRKVLLEAESRGISIVSAGKSKAIAEAASHAADIEGNAVVTVAELRAEKESLTYATMSEMERAKKLLVMRHEEKLAAAMHEYEKECEQIRNDTLAAVIGFLGPRTIQEIAKAGPELQVKLLRSLGLEGYLVTDGSIPINLFDTAAGLTAPPSATN